MLGYSEHFVTNLKDLLPSLKQDLTKISPVTNGTNITGSRLRVSDGIIASIVGVLEVNVAGVSSAIRSLFLLKNRLQFMMAYKFQLTNILSTSDRHCSK